MCFFLSSCFFQNLDFVNKVWQSLEKLEFVDVVLLVSIEVMLIGIEITGGDWLRLF